MELKEKWGLKEGWCWDDDKSEAKECVFIKEILKAKDYKFLCKNIELNIIAFKNFSETDPNKEELKIGEFAYFWDDGWLEKEIVKYARLEAIKECICNYKMKNGIHYTNCSHINPLLK